MCCRWAKSGYVLPVRHHRTGRLAVTPDEETLPGIMFRGVFEQ
jgi:hypothetical protein